MLGVDTANVRATFKYSFSLLPFMKKTITVLGKDISISFKEKEDYISLTDIAKYKNPEHPADIIKNWIRSKETIAFLGLWEKINNHQFKVVEFDQFRNLAGLNSFVLPPQQWIEKTNAIGLISSSGRFGGTFAHKDIAFEFASWISTEFRLYLIKEFQRLKEDENERKSLEWDIRDYADVSQLVCLSNLENLNALFIKEGLDKSKRLEKLNIIAIEQMTILTKDSLKRLK
jgi:hypothetical protein